MAVKTTAIVNASVGKVWALVSDVGGLMRWYPMVRKCEATGSGRGATRKVAFDDWWATELLTEIDDEAHRLNYLITDSRRPIAIGASGRMTLSVTGEGSTRLEWMTRNAPDNPHGAELDAQLAAYYPERVNHLRAALGLPARDCVASLI
ncbi:SRPBCC family protein [Rhizorhabdus argentea]|uniref:SRPBCC family protein n=1 Tax=Rhizorhabdus argentea TaxID=1387174 RepID=UPI0030ECFCA7